MSEDVRAEAIGIGSTRKKSLERQFFKYCRKGTVSDLSASLLALSAGNPATPISILLSTVRTSSDETALHVVIASHASPVTLIEFLLSQGHSPSERGHGTHLRAPLHEAARRTDEFGPRCVEVLIKHGAPVNAVKSGDWTPMMLSALAGVSLSVKHFLRAGARVELKNKDGATVAHLSAKAGSVEALSMILDACPDAVRWRTRNLRTPLHYAARAGSFECVNLLLRRGANVCATEKSGMCAGHEAAAEGEPRVLDLLMSVDSGREAAWKGDVGGLTVLHHAAISGGEEVAEVAVKFSRKADLEREDAHGQTAMFLAAWHGTAGVVSLLERKGSHVKREWVPRFREAGRKQSADAVESMLTGKKETSD